MPVTRSTTRDHSPPGALRGEDVQFHVDTWLCRPRLMIRGPPARRNPSGPRGRGGDPALRMKAIGQCHGDRRRTESLSDPPPKVHPFPGPGSSRDQGGTRTDQSPLGSVLRMQRARRGGPWTDLSRPPGSGCERAVRSGARRCERRPPSEERGRSNARTVKPPCPPRRSHRSSPRAESVPPAESVRHAEIRSALGYDVPRARRLVVPQKICAAPGSP